LIDESIYPKKHFFLHSFILFFFSSFWTNNYSCRDNLSYKGKYARNIWTYCRYDFKNGNYTFWALADGGAPAKLYKYELKSVDSLIEKNQFEDTATLIDSTTFINAGNKDWEELTQSPNQVFIGDFGNNDGNRTDLKIFKFDRNDLGSQNIKVDTLAISYARQIDFSSQRFHAWDCEAMYWENDSLVLLSKGIANSRVYIYKFPDNKGSYALNPIDSFQSTQLITGASNYAGQEISLVGYNF